MKRITKTQILKAIPLREIVLSLFLVGALPAGAQISNHGPMYIADNANMYIGSMTYYFSSGGSTATSRTSSVNGVLSFNADASFNGASDTHFLDGYARATGTAAVLLPIGQSAVYAPVNIVPSALATTNAAYFRAAPTALGSTLDAGLNALSAVEYWDVKSTATARISLTWSSSSENIALLTGSTIAKLTIAAWNGSSWVEIPSVVDDTSVLGGASTLTTGSITSIASVDTGLYSGYTLAVKGGCASLIASSGVTKTWNGSWSPSAPSISDPVIINAAFAGNLSCNSLTLNADVTLGSGQYLDVVNGVTGTGKVVMASSASILQRNPASAAPAIELTKVTNPKRRYDWEYLSSPISNAANFYSQLNSNNNVATNGNYGTQAFTAFNSFRTSDATGAVVSVTAPAVGKLIRATVRNQAPYSISNAAEAWYVETNPIYIKTIGTANNGDVSVTIPPSNNGYIANPYPSAIDGQKVLDAAGDNVRKTIYYWTSNTPMSVAGTYNFDDWASWTTVGGVAACPTCTVPDGNIASMQAVSVLASTAVSSTFNLTNCMRKTGNNTVFYRSSDVKDRFWLNLNGSAGSFSQILLSYVPGSTTGDDNAFDGKRIPGGSKSRVSSLIGSQKYAIQARDAFSDTDAVPLAVDKANNETFTIGLGNKEGVFSDGQEIYLHDTALNLYHNFADGDYAFTQLTDSDNTRFEIVYRGALLGTEAFAAAHVMAALNQEQFSAVATSAISAVVIYDLLGRKIQEFGAGGQKTVTVPFVHAQAIYIAKIKLDNGTEATVKLINK